MLALRCWWLFALATCAGSVKVRTQLHANPIRRVISMLQMMQKKVSAEGGREEDLFNKYMCYCKTSEQTLSKSISDAETKIPQLQSEINAGNAEKAQLTSDIAQAQSDKDAALKSIAEATSIRNKEAEAFRKEDTQDKANEAAMGKALTSLRKGTGSAFLQTSSAAVLQQLTMGSDLPEWDRRTLTAFLSSGQTDQDSGINDAEYAPESADIIGIISQMKETIGKDIASAAAVEKKSIEDFNSLVAAKTKESAALTKELETKNARLGEVGLELVNLAQDLADTTKALELDRKFYADLKKGCDTKQAEWGERSTTRAQELVALSDTIKILNDDMVQHLFRKTMATPSFMQVQVRSSDLLHEARQVLVGQESNGPRDPRMNLISMAMRGKKVNFNKVLAMIDKMITLLGKEQVDDDEKKTYCKQEFAKADDEKMSLAESISDYKKTIANSKEMIGTLNDEIAKIARGIKALNKAVAEATKQRKAQNVAFVEELSSNNAAIEILNIAKNRLNQFYNPALGKAKPKRQLSEADAITVNMGGTLAPTAAPGGLAGTGVVAVQEAFSFLQASEGKSARVAPPPAPSTWGKSEAKGESAGILALLDTLIKDTEKQVIEMKAEEKDAQFEYEQFMADSSEKHKTDAKAISAKESEKAEKEAELQKHNSELKSTISEAAAAAEYLQGLHTECDWLLKNFAVRRDARTSEIASLRQAKAVLNGADYSFLQLEQKVKPNLRRSLLSPSSD